MKNGLTVLCLAAVLGGCMKDGMMLDGAYVRMPEAAINQEPGQAEEPGDRFNEIVENPFIQVSQEPKSTFSVDADGAAYAYFRRMVKMGRLPSPGAVRIEEYLNYFTFDYPDPASGETLDEEGRRGARTALALPRAHRAPLQELLDAALLHGAQAVRDA